MCIRVLLHLQLPLPKIYRQDSSSDTKLDTDATSASIESLHAPLDLKDHSIAFLS
jgi:hypothetical protein